MGLEAVDRLGTDVERTWNAKDYDPRQFPDVAVRALEAADLPARLAPEDVIDWVLATPTLPRQESLPATFGQPPVTLFRARGFYIDALFWVDGSTSIHQHRFSGAFQVLAGSSIESRYTFEPSRAVSAELVIGSLKISSVSLLRKGDVRPIVSGMGGLIHSLFHLERPSVTIVVRSFQEMASGPQFTYARPGVGHNPHYREETLDRTLEILRLLREIDHPELEEIVGALIARSDLHTAYRVLQACSGLPDWSLFNRLVGRVRDTAVDDLFRAVFEESRRTNFLRTRRALVREADLRFFLGVLLNVHRRVDVLGLVRARVPERDPAIQAAAWVRQLSSTNLKIQAAGVPWQPNVLGLPEMNDSLEAALAKHLAGDGAEAGEVEKVFLTALRGIPALNALFG